MLASVVGDSPHHISGEEWRSVAHADVKRAILERGEVKERGNEKHALKIDPREPQFLDHDQRRAEGRAEQS